MDPMLGLIYVHFAIIMVPGIVMLAQELYESSKHVKDERDTVITLPTQEERRAA